MGAKPYDIRERTFGYALRILEIAAALLDTVECRIVRRQLVGAGTSVGANVEEADGASTKADKRRSLVIALKEAREARYWLRIVERKWKVRIDVSADISETSELVKILSVMIARLS